ncbi:MAG: hypothetical protein M3T56_05880 [Chloroflexota bacterium]|nr:hypothetical protein [Chloroflexota bacterium]
MSSPEKLSWAQGVAEARIARQLETADAMDGKGAALFAAVAIVLFSAIAFTGPANEAARIVTVIVAAFAFVLCAAMLWPQRYNDPPDARKLAEALRDRKDLSRDDLTDTLLNQQLDAIVKNDNVLRDKNLGIRTVLLLLLFSVVTFVIEVYGKDGLHG